MDISRALEDPLVAKTLLASGWSPEYRYDSSAWMEALSRDGYSTFEVAEEILAIVGGLWVKPRRRWRAKFQPLDFSFDPVLAATGESERILQREARLGRSLCPIGEWGSEFILLTDPRGRILSESTHMVLGFGSDLSAALILMIRGAPRPEVLYRAQA